MNYSTPPEYTRFARDHQTQMDALLRVSILHRERILEGMTRRFLGPLCPRDPLDMVTVLYARNAAFVEHVDSSTPRVESLSLVVDGNVIETVQL